jgi:hypothetical protein
MLKRARHGPIAESDDARGSHFAGVRSSGRGSAPRASIPLDVITLTR